MLWKNFLLVALGGAIGSLLRYFFSLIIRNNVYPYATLLVNIVGSFAMGIAIAWANKYQQPALWKVFLATGICGGFTTFSAFAWENLQLLQQQRYWIFCLYSGSTLFLGVVAVMLGYSIIK